MSTLQETNGVTELKKRINEIKKQQVQLENIIAKQEDNGVYDDSLYDQIDVLENERNELESQLDSIA